MLFKHQLDIKMLAGMDTWISLLHIFLYFSSIEFWFRAMDFNGDGVISREEMKFMYTYEELRKRRGLKPAAKFKGYLCKVG